MFGDSGKRVFQEKFAIDLGKIQDLQKMITGGIAGAMMGGGTALLARSKFEDKLQDPRDKNLKEKMIGYAPLMGLAAGAILGAKMPTLINKAERAIWKKDKKARDVLLKSDFSSPEYFDAAKNYLTQKDPPPIPMGEILGRSLSKTGSLKSSVKLRDHQLKALDRLDENDGSLIVAHATGSGKTLTGISAYEKLKDSGKAKRAIVVVPASLRENFVDGGVKKFTNSSVKMYGPKNEKKSLNIGQKSKADYNVVSYELFREHGDQIIEDTGADTLIMDEIHKVRSDTGSTFTKIREMRPKFKQAITLTGSVVNNQPNDVVPLMDVTFTPTGHKLINKSFFDKLFVQKDAKRYGFFNPKVEIQKNLKNKGQLGKYLKNKIDFVSHKDLAKDLPNRTQNDINVMMSPEQTSIYNNSMSSVDPITRWKIRNNLPVGQREARDAFSKLLQARQASTDHSIFDKRLADTNPMDYSPKINRIVNDAKDHLKADPKNRTIIYGNLIKGQLDGVEKALKAENVDYSKFVGTGQAGSTNTSRTQAIKDFNANKKRVLVLSGAGAEGLDLKDATMMQMIEGHYNPEKILQAESRIRRLGAFKDKAPEDRNITINRYYSEPNKTGLAKLMSSGSKAVGGGQTGVDKWVYSVAARKDALNEQFRDTLKKEASSLYTIKEFDKKRALLDPLVKKLNLGSIWDASQEDLTKLTGAELLNYTKGTEAYHDTGNVLGKSPEKSKQFFDAFEKSHGKNLLSTGESVPFAVANAVEDRQWKAQLKGIDESVGDNANRSSFLVSQALTGVLGGFIGKKLDQGLDKDIEAKLKQKLLDKGYEGLTGKKHYPKILSASKLDEKVIDAKMGLGMLTTGVGLGASAFLPSSFKKKVGELARKVKMHPEIVTKLGPKRFKEWYQSGSPRTKEMVNAAIGSAALGALAGLVTKPAGHYLKRGILNASLSGEDTQLDRGIDIYKKQLMKKMERKYKSSKNFTHEYETKQELGIDPSLT